MSDDDLVQMIRNQRERQRKNQVEGVPALQRLVKAAHGHSGQCPIIAAFLLSLYNGTRFKFDLTDFRCLDAELFDDCMAVLRMDSRPAQEVHMYFEDGGAMWEGMAKKWGITDYSRLKRRGK